MWKKFSFSYYTLWNSQNIQWPKYWSFTKNSIFWTLIFTEVQYDILKIPSPKNLSRRWPQSLWTTGQLRMTQNLWCWESGGILLLFHTIEAWHANIFPQIRQTKLVVPFVLVVVQWPKFLARKNERLV